jgi:D-arginine dehydrogenase
VSGHGVVVIGGGIAGTSVAAELAAAGVERPVLLEAEPELARHTTGRSAASYIPGHGPAPTQALIAASRDRFEALAQEAGHGFLRPRPVLHVAATVEEERVLRAEILPLAPVTELTPDEAVRRWPALRPGAVRAAAIVEDAMDADPIGLHQHYRRRFRALGGEIRTGARVVGLERRGAGWRVTVADPVIADPATVDADLVVVAAGAWTDRLLALAGAAPIGLTAYRRTIAIARIPPGAPVRPDDPFAVSAGDHWYAKPEGQHLLVSPSEETPQEPGDARPDELDVAVALERVNAVTTLALRSVVTTWAGQRTFAPDRALVVGDRPEHPGLHVFAGQGGSGIETAPAAAALAASVVLADRSPVDRTPVDGMPVDGTPADLRRHGVRADHYSIRRVL